MDRYKTLEQTWSHRHQAELSPAVLRDRAEADFATACVDGEDADESPPGDHIVTGRPAYLSDDRRVDPHIFEDPRRTHTPDSCSSGESMKRQRPIDTPPESPINSTFGSSTDAPIDQLSLEPKRSSGHVNSCRVRELGAAVPATRCKRLASPERTYPNKRSPGTPGQKDVQDDVQSHEEVMCSPGGQDNHRHQYAARQLSGYQYTHGQTFAPDHDMLNGSQDAAQKRIPAHQDSGYQSQPSRTHTIDQLPVPPGSAVVVSPLKLVSEPQGLPTKLSSRQSELANGQLSATRRYPGIISQPDSSPISTDQLATEVKGIYNGLVTVEAKCISIDSGEAADASSELSNEQWQALVALHRTLLYEHHDFLMATQHPSATPTLRGLALKYSMPARMWKHAIHAFLEVLRHRRPASEEYMMSFLILSYQMMALLYETVPMFTDTWIECLGDLARYRMAVEEEKEEQLLWGHAAARWYNMASDRHPAIGRLYHHLGILERLGLKKFFLFAKSVTTIIPFANARDSLSTICKPIVQGTEKGQHTEQSVEARIVSFYAHVFLASNSGVIVAKASAAISRLNEESGIKIRSIGVQVIVANVAALLQFGSLSNRLGSLFGKAMDATFRASRPSTSSPGAPSGKPDPAQSYPLALTYSHSAVRDFCYETFNTLLQHRGDRQSLYDSLPSVHTTLAWLYGVSSLRSVWSNDEDEKLCHSLLSAERFSWVELSYYLNELTGLQSISDQIIGFARQRTFPRPEKDKDAIPLAEDNLIRGLSWTSLLFPAGHFKGQTSEKSPIADTPSMHKCRIERVQWLGLYFAFHDHGHLTFEVSTKSFHAVAKTPLIRSSLAQLKFQRNPQQVKSQITQPRMAPAMPPVLSKLSPKVRRSSRESPLSSTPAKFRDNHEVEIYNEDDRVQCGK